MSKKFSSDSGMQKLFEGFRGFTAKKQLNEMGMPDKLPTGPADSPPATSRENEDLTLKLVKTQGYNDAMDGAEPALPDNEAYMQGYGDGSRDASLERQGHGMASRPTYESKQKDFIK